MAPRPLCGLVVTHDTAQQEALEVEDVSLEFFYISPDDVSVSESEWDFSTVEATLESIAGRNHQAVIRLADLRQHGEWAWELRLPAWLKKQVPCVVREVSGKAVQYPVWNDQQGKYVSFMHSFIRQVAQVLDKDTRVAYVQGFIGHWGEVSELPLRLVWHWLTRVDQGHISRPRLEEYPDDIGVVFPNATQYRDLMYVVDAAFRNTRWSIGTEVSDLFYWYKNRKPQPMVRDAVLEMASFGTFEESFLDVDSAVVEGKDTLLDNCRAENKPERWCYAPRGAEVSFNEINGGGSDSEGSGNEENGDGAFRSSQAEAIEDPDSFKDSVKVRHLTYCLASPAIVTSIANQVTKSFGYRFVGSVTRKHGVVTVNIGNKGCAPIYYDTYVQVGHIITHQYNMKNLLPGEKTTIVVDTGGLSREATDVMLVCDRALHKEIPVSWK